MKNLCYILLSVKETLVKGLKNYKQLHRNTVFFVLFVPTFTRVTITFLKRYYDRYYD